MGFGGMKENYLFSGDDLDGKADKEKAPPKAGLRLSSAYSLIVISLSNANVIIKTK